MSYYQVVRAGIERGIETISGFRRKIDPKARDSKNCGGCVDEVGPGHRTLGLAHQNFCIAHRVRCRRTKRAPFAPFRINRQEAAVFEVAGQVFGSLGSSGQGAVYTGHHGILGISPMPARIPSPLPDSFMWFCFIEIRSRIENMSCPEWPCDNCDILAKTNNRFLTVTDREPESRVRIRCG